MPSSKHYLIISVVTLISTIVLWLSVGVAHAFQNFDGPYYWVIAQTWYAKKIIATNFSFTLPLEYYPAHFPLYPLVSKILSFGLGPIYGMLLVNLGFSIACALTIYVISKANSWGDPLFNALVWLFWWPRIWAVRSIASPETMFIFFILTSIYFFQKNKFWAAGILGSLAVLTKSPGILLFPSFVLYTGLNYLQTKKIPQSVWAICCIPLTLLGLFCFYFLQTGDFFAYFNSGDNIHLQIQPFKVFDSSQAWVGSFWLEDIVWLYVFLGIGLCLLASKNKLWASFGFVFFATLIFVSHRDLSRYALPIAPLAIFGFSHVLAGFKQRYWILAFLIVSSFFYTRNFLNHNAVPISDWAPFTISSLSK